jgi:hypothetical protein
MVTPVIPFICFVPFKLKTFNGTCLCTLLTNNYRIWRFMWVMISKSPKAIISKHKSEFVTLLQKRGGSIGVQFNIYIGLHCRIQTCTRRTKPIRQGSPRKPLKFVKGIVITCPWCFYLQNELHMKYSQRYRCPKIPPHLRATSYP